MHPHQRTLTIDYSLDLRPSQGQVRSVSAAFTVPMAFLNPSSPVMCTVTKQNNAR